MGLLEAFGESGPVHLYSQALLAVRVMIISIMICYNQMKVGSQWCGSGAILEDSEVLRGPHSFPQIPIQLRVGPLPF